MRLHFTALLFAVSLAAQSPRTVPVHHAEYLRFIHADGLTAMGFDVPPLAAAVETLVGPYPDAIKELERVWISTGAQDSVVLMMGHFERGMLARTVCRNGVSCAYLGGPRAMLAGSPAAVEAALARLNSPASRRLGWVARQAWQLAPGRDMWVAVEPQAGLRELAEPLNGIRYFSLGASFGEETKIDGDIVAESDARVEKLLTELETLKASMMRPDPEDEDPAGEAPAFERSGVNLHWAAKVDQITIPPAGAALARPFIALFTGAPAGLAAPAPLSDKKRATPTAMEENFRAVKVGTTRQELLKLLGRPYNITSISGLDIPRETWIYKLPSGRNAMLRLDNGVVTVTGQ